MAKAEEIAFLAGYKRIAVISGVGVRWFYRKLGYELNPGPGQFMIKDLTEDVLTNKNLIETTPISELVYVREEMAVRMQSVGRMYLAKQKVKSMKTTKTIQTMKTNFVILFVIGLILSYLWMKIKF